MIGTPVTKLDSSDLREWELPSGRFVYRDPEGTFSVQPPDDNWWHCEPSLEAAVAWFERRQKEM